MRDREGFQEFLRILDCMHISYTIQEITDKTYGIAQKIQQQCSAVLQNKPTTVPRLSLTSAAAVDKFPLILF